MEIWSYIVKEMQVCNKSVLYYSKQANYGKMIWLDADTNPHFN